MRRSRGYLDALVRSARPARVAAGVSPVRQPDWGPARPLEAEGTEAPDPSPPALRPKRQASVTLPVAEPSSAQKSEDAGPPRRAAPAIPPQPVPPVPVKVSRTEPTPSDARPPAQPAVEPEPMQRAQRIEVARSVDPVRQSPLHASTPAVTALQAALPAATNAAISRLEHLARRFSMALPVEVSRPQPEGQAEPEPKRRSAAREEAAPPTPLVPKPVAPIVPNKPAAPIRAPESARLEIGSIEVFVTQPPAPAPVSTSVIPAHSVVAAPRPAGRLSRRSNPFGFGQC